MKLINYFKSLDYKVFIKMNEYFVYNKLIDPKEVIDILKKYSDLRLVNFHELELYISYRKNKIINLLDNELKLDSKKDKYYIYAGRPDGESINKYRTFSYNDNLLKEDEFPVNPKGVAIFKHVGDVSQKKYIDLNDLLKDNNIGLYIDYKGDMKHIIGYNIEEYNNFNNENKVFRIPILFSGIISNVDRINKKASYDGSIVMNSVSRTDVLGRNILYPILAYFSNNQIIMPDRDSLTDGAKKVWKNYYYKNLMISPHEPIDDFQNTITDKKEDDGKIYRDMDNFSEKDFTNKVIGSEKQQEMLRRIRKDDAVNWVYTLKKEYKNSVSNTVNTLINRHETFYKNMN